MGTELVHNPDGSLCLGEFNGVAIGYDPASDGMVNATQMCRAAARLWADYWRLQSTQEFIEHLSATMGIPIVNLVRSNEGRYGGTWVHRRVALHLAQWCSPAFAVWVTEKIEQLMLTGRVIQHREHQEAELVSLGPLTAAIHELTTEVKTSNANVERVYRDWGRQLDACTNAVEAINRKPVDRVEKAVEDALVRKEGGDRQIPLRNGIADVITSKEVIEIKHWKQWTRAVGQVESYAEDASLWKGRRLNRRIHLFWKPKENPPSDRERGDIIDECLRGGVRVTWHEWQMLERPQVRQSRLALDW